jgi:hypothetical protein
MNISSFESRYENKVSIIENHHNNEKIEKLNSIPRKKEKNDS